MTIFVKIMHVFTKAELQKITILCVIEWDSAEKWCFKDVNYVIYPKYYIPSMPS